MTIAIVEDQALIADLLAAVCRRELKFEVVLTETRGRPALAAIRRLKPHLVLLDLALPDIDGLDVAERILAELPKTRVLALSSLRDPVTIKRVRDLGIHGFVDKREQDVPLLKKAIELVSQGHGYFSPIVGEVAASLGRDPHAFYRILSPTEQDVLRLVGESKTDVEAAQILGVTASTIQSRKRDIMRKLDIHSTPKLIQYAVEQGFIRREPPQKTKAPG